MTRPEPRLALPQSPIDLATGRRARVDRRRGSPDDRSRARRQRLQDSRARHRRSPPNGSKGGWSGSNGERLASDYLVSQLRRIGAKPLPGATDFLLPFEFTAGTRDGGSTAQHHRHSVERESRRSPSEPTCRRCRSRTTATSSGSVVFAGYGIVVPEAQNFGYDSYATLDVKDKIVLVLRYFPEDADVKTKGILARYADLRYKAMAARQRGAKAMLVVAGPQLAECRRNDSDVVRHGAVRLGHRCRQHQRRRRRRHVRDAGRSGQDAGSGAKIARYRQPARRRLRDSGRRASTFTRAVVREKRTGHNVAGYLPATASDRRCREAVGGARRALRSPGTRRERQLARRQGRRGTDSPRRRRQRVRVRGGARGRRSHWPRSRAIATSMLEFWSGEELGLIGSTAYVNKPPVPLDQTRRVSELRHGRPHAGQQAHRAGDGDESGVGPPPRTGQHRGRIRPADPDRSVSADRCRELQSGERAVV